MKIGEERYMKKLFEEGEIFMQLSSEFHNDKNGERGDELEGLITQKIIYVEEFTMTPLDGGEPIPITPTDGIMKKRQYTGNPFYIYCLWCLDTRTAESQSENLTVVKNLADFKGLGDTCVIINSEKFIDRVKAKLREMGIDHHCEMVKYIDLTTHDGDVTPFMKDVKFAHQQEYRFIVMGGTEPTFSFNIGSLKDIAHLTNLNNYLRMEFYGEIIESE